MPDSFIIEYMMKKTIYISDLSMFSVADRAYAVANAVPAVKERADRVIGANTACGVPAFMEQELEEAAHGTV